MTVPENEARKVMRMPGDTFGPLQLAATPSGSFSADVQDISVLGVGLIGDTDYPAGTVFVIESGPHGLKPPMALKMELRHATQRPDGRWLLGCSFARPLTADDVLTMG